LKNDGTRDQLFEANRGFYLDFGDIPNHLLSYDCVKGHVMKYRQGNPEAYQDYQSESSEAESLI